MPHAIGFDVYGTLVDPLAMRTHLEAVVGEHAGQMAQLWLEKQIEYTFRRALMQSDDHRKPASARICRLSRPGHWPVTAITES